MKKSPALISLLLIALLTAGIYALGLNNGLVFDDERFNDGSIYGQYGNLLQFKQRTLSYSSFVWVNTVTPDNIAVQRAINLVLHLLTALSVHALLARLMAHTNLARGEAAELAPAQQAGLAVGMVFFALAPVAVYAVGYLIQRSILMATLFGVLACYAYVRALGEKKPAWLGASALAYLLAVMSKEHAFLVAGLAIPLYVFMVRPTWQRATAVTSLAALALAAGVGLLVTLYPNLVGQIFDETSAQLAAQLDKQRPGAAAQIFPLSVLNQAALFFYYGFLWVFPVVGWMSIDMRPPFPLSLGTWPHLLGALAYVGLLVLSTWAVLRRSDTWGFIGLCLLFPLILFWTEFATVWVQDPMVLYRSYLWAIPVPGLIAMSLAATGFSTRVLYAMAVAAALVLGALSAERVLSMKSPLTVWTDAVEKTDIKGPPNAVGRYRAFLNRGAQYLLRFSAELALPDFRTAQALGEPTGGAVFNMGVAQQVLKKHPDALKAFDQAEAVGFTDGVLHHHRGDSLAALGRYPEAIQAYDIALTKPMAPIALAQSHLRRAETLMRMGRFAEAVGGFERVIQLDPNNLQHLTGLGMAKLGNRDADGAMAIFNRLLSQPQDAKQTALAHYGRAMAYALLKQPAQARTEIAEAARLDPQKAMYQQIQKSWVNDVTLPKEGT